MNLDNQIISRYGKTPSEDQIKASGGYCPICQDTYHDPVMLHCKHIFCEECVATWFDRDTTCPMCRYPEPTALQLSLLQTMFAGPRCQKTPAGETEPLVNSSNFSKQHLIS